MRHAACFAALGAALLLLQKILLPAGDDRLELVLAESDVERIYTAWQSETGVRPDAPTRARLLEEAIEDEILLREALALGLDHKEPIVRERLVQLARYLGSDAAPAAGLEAEARALGLDRRDPVVRRHLIQSMRLLLSRPTRNDAPSDAELEAYRVANAARFERPATLRFVHVYLSREGRPDLASDADRLLRWLRRERVAPHEGPALGDAFAAGARVGPASAARIDRLLGVGFSEQLAEAASGYWSGPHTSAYGLHLVWIERRDPARLPDVDEVRNELVHGLLRERREERLRRSLAELRGRYRIRVEIADARGAG